MKGRSDPSWEDVLIAAAARVHRLVIVAQNGKDFDPFGEEYLNPFNCRKTESD